VVVIVIVMALIPNSGPTEYIKAIDIIIIINNYYSNSCQRSTLFIKRKDIGL
jgi:hypothetical protein